MSSPWAWNLHLEFSDSKSNEYFLALAWNRLSDEFHRRVCNVAKAASLHHQESVQPSPLTLIHYKPI
jgi:hypothetical protein